MAGFTPVNARKPAKQANNDTPVNRPNESTTDLPISIKKQKPSSSSGPSNNERPTRNGVRSSSSTIVNSIARKSVKPIKSSQTEANGSSSGSSTTAGLSHHNAFIYPQQHTRANPPLDLSTVKRRQDNIPDPVKQGRPFGLEDVPTLQPTAEEFSDPLQYISSISSMGKKYGMVKIIPPDSWNPPFCMDTDLFWFNTRRQIMHSTDRGEKLKAHFVDALYKFHQHVNGTPINKLPSIDRRPLDLFHLHRCVQLRGGFDEVCKKKLWAQIGREMGYSGKIMTSLSTSLKSAYQKLLFPFDEYLEKMGNKCLSNGPIINESELEAIDKDLSDQESTESNTASDSLSAGDKHELERNDDEPPGKRIKIDDENYARVICSEAPLHRIKLYSDVASTPDDPTLPPFDNWHKGGPLLDEYEHELKESPSYNLRQFQQKAELFKSEYFKSINLEETNDENAIEQQFWKILEDKEQFVEIEYGADVHTSLHRSPFPQIERDTELISKDQQESLFNAWNLNVIPFDEKSFCRYIEAEIPYLTRPWLYVGMIFASQSWHFEDFYSYSVNYHHFGDTKTWYSVPEDHFEKFFNLLVSVIGSENLDHDPRSILEANVMTSPEMLVKNGIKCYSLDQRPGQLVITFPKIFHSHFNHGFNLTESVNIFPVNDWLDYGKQCLNLYNKHEKSPPFSIQRLLLSVASNDQAITTSRRLSPLIQEMYKDEMNLRHTIREKYPNIKEIVKAEDVDTPNRAEQFTCSKSKDYCYLSRMVNTTTNEIISIQRFLKLNDIKEEEYQFVLLYSDVDFATVCNQVSDRAVMPDQWYAKVDKLFATSPRPSLKTLKSLVSEGERIPFAIPTLASLKKTIDRASSWVEEVQLLLSRRSSNRRHSERNVKVEPEVEEKKTPEYLQKLLDQSSKLPFSCPEIGQLHDRVVEIYNYVKRVESMVEEIASSGKTRPASEYEEMLDVGKSFNIALPETDLLEKIVARIQWVSRANEANVEDLDLDAINELISEGEKGGIDYQDDSLMVRLLNQRALGMTLEDNTKNLLENGQFSIDDVEALLYQCKLLPVSKWLKQTLNDIKNRHMSIVSQATIFVAQAKQSQLELRPLYKDVKKLVDDAKALGNGKSTLYDIYSLDRELRQVEEWMRKGKRIFGKGNAPLHILTSHVTTANQRTAVAFAIDDVALEEDNVDRGEKKKPFCLCRMPESGIMVQCDNCKEWYHGKCLKFGRNKVKAETYVCPVCDWRVEIPREANRPKVDELEQLIEQARALPMLPNELEPMKNLVKTTNEFQSFLHQMIFPPLGTDQDRAKVLKTSRFYMAKLEGGDILLADEINFLRSKIHELSPISDDVPPPVETSQKTKKPRKPKAAADSVISSPLPKVGEENPSSQAIPMTLQPEDRLMPQQEPQPPASQPFAQDLVPSVTLQPATTPVAGKAGGDADKPASIMNLVN